MMQSERGAAVVMAMLVVAVSVVLVSGVFHRQSAMVRQLENDVAAAQAQLLLSGAIDWVRVILREDARTSATDDLGEPWAVPLQQTRLDSEGSDPAWLSGAMEDAQSRFNLRNVSGPMGPIASEVAALRRLLDLVGADPMLAESLAQDIDVAMAARTAAPGDLMVLPATLADIQVQGSAERAALDRLRPFVTVLPMATAINANTASAEVLAARFDHLALADARRLVTSRERASFKDVNDVLTRVPGLNLTGGAGQVTVATQFFLLRGTVEFRRAHLQALVLLKREAGRVEVVWTREGSV